VEVQLSRQLEAGESQVDNIEVAPAKGEHANHNVTTLSAQGA
jgi:biopolymer transport protein TolQ